MYRETRSRVGLASVDDGESGTGKEPFAQVIHQESPRTGRPFVLINCAAIRVALLESELFSYMDGFPHAKNGRS
nr:sigma 54-interacting transcriptional regulator [Geobacillus sp. BMUD]